MTPGCDQPEGLNVCPDVEATLDQLLVMQPRGRAWETPHGSVRWRFWRAVADLIAFANARICALYEEFFCATVEETVDDWMRDYGLPDGCDPYPDLCGKVAAIGGQTCAYLVAMAWRAGFAVACVDLHGAEADCAEADCAEAAPEGSVAGMLGLRVDVAASPALGSAQGTPVEADLLEASQPIYCEADISSLRCLMDRIAPAHLLIVYIIA